MFLMALFSTFYLLTAPTVANPSTEIIRQQHLETAEGRIAFLNDRLAPYTAAANQMNLEIQDLAAEIKALSPQDEQPQIVALTETMTQKMAKLITMLPALDIALSIDEDFQQIETILRQTDPLSTAQQQVIDRIASLCSSIEKF